MRYRNLPALSILFLMLSMLLVGCAHESTQSLDKQKDADASPANEEPTQLSREHYVSEEEGTASYYGIRDGFHGRRTATGETYNAHGISAAHKTLPLPSVVRVTNLENGRSLTLKVNDRGSYRKGRVIDVSEKSAKLLGFHRQGLARVKVQHIADESLTHKDPHKHVPILTTEDGKQTRVEVEQTTGHRLISASAKRKKNMPKHRPKLVSAKKPKKKPKTKKKTSNR